MSKWLVSRCKMETNGSTFTLLRIFSLFLFYLNQIFLLKSVSVTFIPFQCVVTLWFYNERLIRKSHCALYVLRIHSIQSLRIEEEKKEKKTQKYCWAHLTLQKRKNKCTKSTVVGEVVVRDGVLEDRLFGHRTQSHPFLLFIQLRALFTLQSDSPFFLRVFISRTSLGLQV